jgi:hypothetical protein
MEHLLFQTLIESGGNLGKVAFWAVWYLALLWILQFYFSSTLNYISKNKEIKWIYKIEKLRSKRKQLPP